MESPRKPVRVLYSFPHKLGADRICYTAWQQVNGLAAAGVNVLAFPGALHRPVPASVTVRPTLAWKKLRIPYRLLGKMRALALHDRIVARRLEKLVGQVDLVHAWPVAALETLKTAAKLGIPTVIERPNAHTRFAFEAVGREFERLGLVIPPDDEYFHRDDVLSREEAEYQLADYILCPSDFVVRTFEERGVRRSKLLRHTYGYNEEVFYPRSEISNRKDGLKILFVGVCAVRKGVHFALEAWLRSPASKEGTFLIAGAFLPSYAAKLGPMLLHSSVKVLGHRNDVPDLMRESDILVLPSIEEGYGLVIAEAMGSGCVPLASDACTEICEHMVTGLVHRAGDVGALSDQITLLHTDRDLLSNLRSGALARAGQNTWKAAGERLLQAYIQALSSHKSARQGASYRAGTK